MPDPFGSFAGLYDQPDAASGVDASKFYADWLRQRAPASALDTSGMGATVPPDTWEGRMSEATGGDIRNPADRQAMVDFAMGMVGPGAIKGVRGGVVPPGETLNFKSAGAAPGGERVPLSESPSFDRPPTAKELREAAQYDAMLAAGRARAEARKAAAASSPPAAPGETLNYRSAGAPRGQTPAIDDPFLEAPIPQSVPQRSPASAVAPEARAAPLAIKDAIEASPPADDMVRLYRGGGNNAGGPKWVTTDRRYAERYTTPGLAHSEGAGSYLQYVDVPKSDPRVRIPAGQSTHSFEAGPDIADSLKPLYSDPRKTAPAGAPAASPAADTAAKVRSAFDAAVRENGGHGQTEIANIQRRSGIPMADLHQYLLQEARAGRATLHPTTQAPIQIPETMAAGIKLPGHPDPLVSVRLK